MLPHQAIQLPIFVFVLGETGRRKFSLCIAFDNMERNNSCIFRLLVLRRVARVHLL